MTKSETVSDSTLAVDDEPRRGEVAKVPAAPLRAPRPDEIASIAQAKTRLAKMLPRAMVNTRDGEDGSLQITMRTLMARVGLISFKVRSAVRQKSSCIALWRACSTSSGLPASLSI